jgi:hypothetical protein
MRALPCNLLVYFPQVLLIPNTIGSDGVDSELLVLSYLYWFHDQRKSMLIVLVTNAFSIHSLIVEFQSETTSVIFLRRLGPRRGDFSSNSCL